MNEQTTLNEQTTAQVTRQRLTAGATPEEFAHVTRMCVAMVDAVKTGHIHGGFIEAMVRRDFEEAFRMADGTNSRYFGALMAFRLYHLGDRKEAAKE